MVEELYEGVHIEIECIIVEVQYEGGWSDVECIEFIAFAEVNQVFDEELFIGYFPMKLEMIIAEGRFIELVEFGVVVGLRPFEVH